METVDKAKNPLRSADDYRINRVAGPSAVVIFGASGDLATKKLIPAIYDLSNRGLLPPGFALVGVARRKWSDDEFGEYFRQSALQHGRTPWSQAAFAHLKSGIRYVAGEFSDLATYRNLNKTLQDLDRLRGTGGNHAFYLSIPPKEFLAVTDNLCQSGLAHASSGRWRRVVIEKPFGHDLSSAKELNRIIESVFPADSVFRIDHYLGKETVQNLMVLRFANRIFEPIWNSDHVDHVQITMAEDIGLGGRAGYYDGVGAARDVIQNHMLQLLALTAMDEPLSFRARDVRIEKEKVLQAVRVPEDVMANSVRGQYAAGWLGGEKVVGFLQEKGMNPASLTETYAAVRLDIPNRRWQGVPFYLRTGKRLARRVTEISLVFKGAPRHDNINSYALKQNSIIIKVQPDEGVSMNFGSKVPGDRPDVRQVNMDFGYTHSFMQSSPEAYERLILDILRGEPSIFPQQREVELSWQILDPIEEAWAKVGSSLPQYTPGTWGPVEADQLLARTNRVWRRP